MFSIKDQSNVTQADKANNKYKTERVAELEQTKVKKTLDKRVSFKNAVEAIDDKIQVIKLPNRNRKFY